MFPIDQDPLTHSAMRRAEWEREVERMRLVTEARRMNGTPHEWKTPDLWTRMAAALRGAPRPMVEPFTPILIPEPHPSKCDCVD